MDPFVFEENKGHSALIFLPAQDSEQYMAKFAGQHNFLANFREGMFTNK
jgi:hypothetical protein